VRKVGYKEDYEAESLAGTMALQDKKAIFISTDHEELT